jgi:hypothetical protein
MIGLDLEEERRNHGNGFLSREVSLEEARRQVRSVFTHRNTRCKDVDTYYVGLVHQELLKLLVLWALSNDLLPNVDLPSQPFRIPIIHQIRYGQIPCES